MHTKNKYIIISIAIVFIFLILLPIKYPITIKTKGKMLAYKSWVISKGTDGRLLTSLTNNLSGISNNYTITQFERGDAVQFKLNDKILNDTTILQGDTIGFIISNEIQKDIERLRGQLETAKASLKVQTSSEKESIIAAEKNKLAFAQKELDEQTKLFERSKQLYERDLISRQDYEAAEAKYELAKINIEIAKQVLRTVESGAKEEEVKLTATTIDALENEIKILQSRYESNNIISPINGIVNRAFSSDTLLIINDTSKYVILLPVKWQESLKLSKEQNVNIYDDYITEIAKGKIVSIENSVKVINQTQYVITTVLLEDKIKNYKPGLIVNCEIEIGNVTATEFILNFLQTLYR